MRYHIAPTEGMKLVLIQTPTWPNFPLLWPKPESTDWQPTLMPCELQSVCKEKLVTVMNKHSNFSFKDDCFQKISAGKAVAIFWIQVAFCIVSDPLCPIFASDQLFKKFRSQVAFEKKVDFMPCPSGVSAVFTHSIETKPSRYSLVEMPQVLI